MNLEETLATSSTCFIFRPEAASDFRERDDHNEPSAVSNIACIDYCSWL